MKKIIVVSALISVTSFILIVTSPCATKAMSEGEYMAYKVSQVIGTNVRNLQGEDLGKIHDIVIDSHGRTAFAILSYGGFMGMGGKLVAVPFSALTFDHAGKHLVLNIERERLESAPAFDTKDLANLKSVEDINQYFGQQPYWTEGGGATGPSIERPMKDEKLEEFPSDYEEVGMDLNGR